MTANLGGLEQRALAFRSKLSDDDAHGRSASTISSLNQVTKLLREERVPSQSLSDYLVKVVRGVFSIEDRAQFLRQSDWRERLLQKIYL